MDDDDDAFELLDDVGSEQEVGNVVGTV